MTTDDIDRARVIGRCYLAAPEHSDEERYLLLALTEACGDEIELDQLLEELVESK